MVKHGQKAVAKRKKKGKRIKGEGCGAKREPKKNKMNKESKKEGKKRKKAQNVQKKSG